MKKMILAAAAAAVISGSAFAAVSFDPVTGTGFVGKGDIQILYGWNNKQLQNNAGGVSFAYNASSNYEAVCTFTTGEGTRGERIHNVEHKVKTEISSSIAYAARRNSNGKDGDITGFNLTGPGAVTESGEVPVVNGPCMGNSGHEGVWTSVVQTGGTEGGLSVTYGGLTFPLPNTPIVVVI